MTLKAISTRLTDLDRNIDLALELIRDLEEELLYETDPIKTAKYERDKKRIAEKRHSYQREIEAIQAQAVGGNATSEITNRIDEVTKKLEIIRQEHDDISRELGLLRAAVLGEIGGGHQRLLEPVINLLPAAELSVAQAALAKVDNADLDEREIAEVIDEVRIAANLAVETDLIKEPSMKANLAELADAIEDPKLGIKHKLKLTIPIIPFLISYEGEASWDNTLNLEKAAQWLTGRRKEKA
jgi:hypothetical protein